MTQITNYENTPDRQARLHRVMAGMTTQYGIDIVCEKIAQLHDHKGVLEVRWRGPTDSHMARTLGTLWELNGEPADNIEHEVV